MTIQSVQTDNQGLQVNTQYYDQTLVFLTSLITVYAKIILKIVMWKHSVLVQIKEIIINTDIYRKLLRYHCFIVKDMLFIINRLLS